LEVYLKNYTAFPKLLSCLLSLVFLTCALYCQTSWAYFTTFDTADTLSTDHYRLGPEGQFIFNKLQGFNAISHFDMGVGEGQEMKFVLGTGIVNFQAGAFYKWIPIPDVDKQPGIGAFMGFLYGYQNGASIMNLRFHPLVSKKFIIDGKSYITPYASVPFGVSFGSGTTTAPIQMAIGAEWLPQFLNNLRIMSEIGFEINAAFSYFSMGLNVPFESFDKLKLD
jgi:hypothetical protein